MDKLAIYQFLGEQKIPYEKIEHPAVFNMEQLASIHLPHPEWDAKNLFVCDDKKQFYALITVKGDKNSKLVGTLMVTNGTDGHIEIKGGTYENSQYCPIYINGAVSTENSTLSVKSATITALNSGSGQDMLFFAAVTASARVV